MAITAFEHDVLTISFNAGEDLSAKQFFAVTLESDDTVDLADSAGERCLGILTNAPTSGQQASIQVLGVAKAAIGGTVTSGDLLVCDANGKLVVRSGTSQQLVGRALSAGSSGEIIPVMLGVSDTSSGAGTWCIPLDLAEIANGDVAAIAPDFAGTITSVKFSVTVVSSTADKGTTLNLEIGSTNLAGGVVTLTTANTDAKGDIVAGTAITADNVFTSTSVITIEAASTTAFVEGKGVLMINYAAA